jgi:staphylococcal nuclease domain-containing protein 1
VSLCSALFPCLQDWVEPTPEEKAALGVSDRDDEESKESGPTERIARITEIVDAGDFFVQWVGDKNAEAVEKALAAVAAQPESDEPFNRPPNSNGRAFIAAGQFSDDSWHRVRCDGQDVNGDWNVYFVDYGNYDTLLSDRLRHLPADAQKIPPLAIHAALAGLTAPKAPEYQEGSALAFSEMAFGIDLKATIEFSDKFGRKHLTLSHESHPISVNRQLLRDGWAKVQARPDRRIQKLANELAEEEKYAKDHHYNLFEYGDVSEEEEGEKILGPDPKARGQKPKPADAKKK